MRILVVSDAHGSIAPVEKAIDNSNPDYLIYLGDGAEMVEDISYLYPDIKFYFVGGNCDFGNFEVEQEVKIGGKRFFFTHGHNYYVKMGYERIIEEGIRRKADFVLFGHTHVPYNEYIDGLYVLNPGSVARAYEGRPSYAFIDLMGNKVFTNIVYL